MSSITDAPLLSDFVLKIAKVADTASLSMSWHILHLRSDLQVTKSVYTGYMQVINVRKIFGVAHGIAESLGTWKNQTQRTEKEGMSGQIHSQNSQHSHQTNEDTAAGVLLHLIS